MAEEKGLKKPVKLKSELASMLGETQLPRTEITKKLWDYSKANKLQTKNELHSELMEEHLKIKKHFVEV